MRKRARSDVFMDAVEAYFRTYFNKRCQEEGLSCIRQWGRGYSAEPLSANSEYPAALTMILRKNALDSYTGTYSCSIAVALTGDTPSELERQGLVWQDIIEDAIRADYHLGGACLDVDPFEIFSAYADDLCVIACEFTCEIDMGGYLYEE